MTGGPTPSFVTPSGPGCLPPCLGESRTLEALHWGPHSPSQRCCTHPRVCELLCHHPCTPGLSRQVSLPGHPSGCWRPSLHLAQAAPHPPLRYSLRSAGPLPAAPCFCHPALPSWGAQPGAEGSERVGGRRRRFVIPGRARAVFCPLQRGR